MSVAVVHVFAAIASVALLWGLYLQPIMEEYQSMTGEQRRALIELTIAE